MRLLADAPVCDFVASRGGVLWLRSTQGRCCFGPVTSLRAATSRPEDANRYLSLATDLPIDVRFLGAGGAGGAGDRPHELTVELRGRLHRHLVALWDGCKFKL